MKQSVEVEHVDHTKKREHVDERQNDDPERQRSVSLRDIERLRNLVLITDDLVMTTAKMLPDRMGLGFGLPNGKAVVIGFSALIEPPLNGRPKRRLSARLVRQRIAASFSDHGRAAVVMPFEVVFATKNDDLQGLSSKAKKNLVAADFRYAHAADACRSRHDPISVFLERSASFRSMDAANQLSHGSASRHPGRVLIRFRSSS